MARLVTYASFQSTQDTRGPRGWRSRPACYAVYRALLHETATDCSPACQEEETRRRLSDQSLGFPHVDLADGELVAVVTPLCTAHWITADLAEWYATPEAPAFAWPDTLADRAELRSVHLHTHREHDPSFWAPVKVVFGVACWQPGTCDHGRQDNWYANEAGEWRCGCPEYPGQLVTVRAACQQPDCPFNCPGCGVHLYGRPEGDGHYSDCQLRAPGQPVYARTLS